jgi:hypothetical protein
MAHSEDGTLRGAAAPCSDPYSSHPYSYPTLPSVLSTWAASLIVQSVCVRVGKDQPSFPWMLQFARSTAMCARSCLSANGMMDVVVYLLIYCLVLSHPYYMCSNLRLAALLSRARRHPIPRIRIR